MMGVLFAVIAYLAGNAVIVGTIVFLTDHWMPHTVDRSLWPVSGLTTVLAVDVGLIVLFGLQHSVMARAGFKRWLTSVVPAHVERSVYLLATFVVLGLLLVCWQPIPAVLWEVTQQPYVGLLWALFVAGWLLTVASTYMIDHFSLFGLTQAWRHYRASRGRILSPESDSFRTPLMYRLVRHPLYLGLLIGFWTTPKMTVGHALLAAGITLYILVGIAFEERDLIANFGERYSEYRRRVPALIPGLKIGQ